MRTIHIDFLNTGNPLPDGDVLGNQGEHNATVLVITPPAEMTENEKITSYRIAFELSNCRAVHSKDITKADVISLPLFSQITSSETIAVQLEGYDENGDVIVKSPKIKKLKFNPSVCGIEIRPSDSPNCMAAEVKHNTEFRKNFNEDEDGNLTYKGNYISGQPIATIPLSDFVAIDTGYGITIALTSDVIPVGTELKTIRFNYGGQLIDIKDMATIDEIPYVLNMNKVLTSSVMGLPVLAVLGFWADKNTIASALLDFVISKIEVDYYL